MLVFLALSFATSSELLSDCNSLENAATPMLETCFSPVPGPCLCRGGGCFRRGLLRLGSCFGGGGGGGGGGSV